MPGDGDPIRVDQIEVLLDRLRGKYRERAIPTDAILASTFGPVQGATDGAVLASFTAGAGVTTGSFADIIGLDVSVDGETLGLYARAVLVDRRRGTFWSAYMGTSSNKGNRIHLRAPPESPLWAGAQGTVRLLGFSATTGSWTGFIQAVVDHHGSEGYGGGQY